MPSRLDTALSLLHSAVELGLATHSVSDPGYPFATTVACCTDERHRPVVLLSRLAEHTRNVLADARVSAVVSHALGGGEIARASLIGHMTPITPEPELTARYLRYHPAAERFLALGDFGFYRLEPKRIRVVGGFAQAGWIDGTRLIDAPSLSVAQEAELIEAAQPRLGEVATLLGIDAYGVDYRIDDTRSRNAFPSGARAPEAVAAAVMKAVEKLKTTQSAK